MLGPRKFLGNPFPSGEAAAEAPAASAAEAAAGAPAASRAEAATEAPVTGKAEAATEAPATSAAEAASAFSRSLGFSVEFGNFSRMSAFDLDILVYM